MPNDDLSGQSFADVLEDLEAGKIGHSAAMIWLGINSYADLVRIMHLNGRQMPGHRAMVVTPQTRAVLLRATRPRRKLRAVSDVAE